MFNTVLLLPWVRRECSTLFSLLPWVGGMYNTVLPAPVSGRDVHNGDIPASVGGRMCTTVIFLLPWVGGMCTTVTVHCRSLAACSSIMC